MQMHVVKRIFFAFVCCFFSTSNAIFATPPPNFNNGDPCELSPPKKINLDFATSQSAQLSWTPVVGAIGYQTELIDLTDSSVHVDFTPSTIKTYNASVIQPGHSYTFSVASVCQDSTVGLPSKPLRFQAPVIVIIDIVDRACQPIKDGAPGMFLLPSPDGNINGKPVSFDITYGNAAYRFDVQTSPGGDLLFTQFEISGTYLECAAVSASVAGCSQIIIKKTGNGNNPELVLARLFAAVGSGNQRYLLITDLYPNTKLFYCGIDDKPNGGALQINPSGVSASPNPGTEETTSRTAQETGDMQKNQVYLWPNPATDQLYLNYTGMKDQPVIVTLFDINGKTLQSLVFETDHNQPLSVDLSQLESGMYFLTLTDGQHHFSSRFFKQ